MILTHKYRVLIYILNERKKRRRQKREGKKERIKNGGREEGSRKRENLGQRKEWEN